MKRAKFNSEILHFDSCWDDWIRLVCTTYKQDAGYELQCIYYTLPGVNVRPTSRSIWFLYHASTGGFTVGTKERVYMYVLKTQPKIVFYIDDNGNIQQWTEWTYRKRWPWRQSNHGKLMAHLLPGGLWVKILNYLDTREMITLARTPLASWWINMLAKETVFWDALLNNAIDAIPAVGEWAKHVKTWEYDSSLLTLRRMVSSLDTLTEEFLCKRQVVPTHRLIMACFISFYTRTNYDITNPTVDFSCSDISHCLRVSFKSGNGWYRFRINDIFNRNYQDNHIELMNGNNVPGMTSSRIYLSLNYLLRPNCSWNIAGKIQALLAPNK